MKSTRFPPPVPPLDIPGLLHQYGLHATKRLGQNFLHDTYALKKIVSLAELQPSDTVLEIGPGLGSLTRYLAASAQNVLAIELDGRLFPVLEDILAPYQNIQLVQADILDIDPGDLIGSPGYVVVANIPYYITSALIRHLLEKTPKPRKLVLTIQKEVAQRICASPGEMSLLALSVQVYGLPRIGGNIPANAFFPVPRVESAVLVIDLYDSPVVAPALLDIFFLLIKAGFSQKRKTLRNSISAGMRKATKETEELLRRSDIDPRRRAETLDLNEWQELSKHFHQRYPD